MNHSLEKEAAALGVTVQELQAQRDLEAEVREAASLGLDVWELRMRKAGETEQAIEQRRIELRKQRANALRMSYADFCKLNGYPES